MIPHIGQGRERRLCIHVTFPPKSFRVAGYTFASASQLANTRFFSAAKKCYFAKGAICPKDVDEILAEGDIIEGLCRVFLEFADRPNPLKEKKPRLESIK